MFFLAIQSADSFVLQISVDTLKFKIHSRFLSPLIFMANSINREISGHLFEFSFLFHPTSESGDGFIFG